MKRLFFLPVLLFVAQCFSQPGLGKDQNLLSGWSCNDGSSTVAGDHAGGRHLTLTNGPTWGTNTIVYDGTNDYSIRSGVNLGLNGTTELSVFFKLKTTDAAGRIIQKGYGITDGVNTFRIQLTATGVILFAMDYFIGGQNPQWEITTPLDFSTLTSVAFTFKVNAGDATDGLVYINGSTVGTTFTANGYFTTFFLEEISGDFVVAIRPLTATDPLAGEVGSIKVFNRQLTATQVAALVN